MTDLGDMEDVTFDPGLQTAHSTSANSGDRPLATSIQTLPGEALVTASLYDQSIEALAELLDGEVVEEAGSSALQLGATVRQLNAKVLAIIPQARLDEGSDSPYGLWLPAAFVRNLTDLFQHQRLVEGANNNPITAEFMAAESTEFEELAGTNEAAWFRGSPAAFGLTWSLPIDA